MPQTLTAAPLITKGRSKRLVALRNQRMIVRYYYWREIQRRRSDDVFEILSNDEFFLEEITVRRIVRDQLDFFTQLKKEKASEKRLQQIIREMQEARYSQMEMFD